MEKHPKATKSNKHFQLDPERLATTNETGKRIYLYPAFVKGKFRKARTLVYWFLVLFFLGLPWIKINHHSAVLLDIVHRKFSLFGLTFWGHDVPILFLILASSVLFLGFLTAILGRVWCGWMCPQTVFIDVIFRKIETLIEGSPNDRKKLDKSPWTMQKISKRSFKWALFIVCSFIITHSFLAYFTGTDVLANIVTHPPSSHPKACTMMLIANAIILFNFGWFREQFCIIACPYGRFQSVFMDPNSLIVGYDTKRNDCIDCLRCVQVCPTGVDIRRGVQMECIMCTACIDACDQVMDKINKPRNLISYTTGHQLSGKVTKWLRPRLYIYIGLITVLLTLLTFVVINRDLTPMFARTSKESPYMVLSQTTLANPYTITIHNQYFEPIQVEITPLGTPDIKWITPTPILTIPGGQTMSQTVIIEFPKSTLQNGKYTLKLNKKITHPHHKLPNKIEEITLVGPML